MPVVFTVFLYPVNDFFTFWYSLTLYRWMNKNIYGLLNIYLILLCPSRIRVCVPVPAPKDFEKSFIFVFLLYLCYHLLIDLPTSLLPKGLNWKAAMRNLPSFIHSIWPFHPSFLYPRISNWEGIPSCVLISSLQILSIRVHPFTLLKKHISVACILLSFPWGNPSFSSIH